MSRHGMRDEFRRMAALKDDIRDQAEGDTISPAMGARIDARLAAAQAERAEVGLDTKVAQALKDPRLGGITGRADNSRKYGWHAKIELPGRLSEVCPGVRRDSTVEQIVECIRHMAGR